MLLSQRHDLILKQLSENGSVSNSDLSKSLNVSSETIRKDLELLEKKQLLMRVHGGAVAFNVENKNDAISSYVNFDVRTEQHLDTKIKLAQKAAEFVSEGQSIALDAGTSSLVLAKVLKEKFNKLTVITNSIKIILEFISNPNITVISTGGLLTREEYSFVSEFSYDILEKFNVDIAFLSASGVTASSGLTDQRLLDVKVQEKMIKCAQKTIALVDSSKFGKPSLAKICSLNDVDVLITDDNISEQIYKEIAPLPKKFIIV